MFRAVLRSSSGDQIVLLQHLVSSLSLNGRTVRRLRAESALNWRTLQPFTESDIPDAVIIQFDLLKMSIVLLETCRGL